MAAAFVPNEAKVKTQTQGGSDETAEEHSVSSVCCPSQSRGGALANQWPCALFLYVPTNSSNLRGRMMILSPSLAIERLTKIGQFL